VPAIGVLLLVLQGADHADDLGEGRAPAGLRLAALKDGRHLDLVAHRLGTLSLRVVVALADRVAGGIVDQLVAQLGHVARHDDLVHDVQVGHFLQQAREVHQVPAHGRPVSAVQVEHGEGAGAADGVDTVQVHLDVVLGALAVEGEAARRREQRLLQQPLVDAHDAVLPVDLGAMVRQQLERRLVLHEHPDLGQELDDGEANLLQVVLAHEL
jgi:hypothetical protein